MSVCYKGKNCLFSSCKKPIVMSTLLDLLTKQLNTDNTEALASSSLTVITHLKTFQVQNDDPNNGKE